jgi:hypothetical protein
MSTSKLHCSNPFRRLAASLAVAALLAMPIAAGAAPVAGEAAAWAWSWDGVLEQVASWLGWAAPQDGRATGASGPDLGSTLDPDGRGYNLDTPNGGVLTVPDGSTSELGSTLDPDGTDPG